jgi:hypothetical protein
MPTPRTVPALEALASETLLLREQGSGNVGSFSKYLEIPDLSKGKLAASSLFLFATDAKGSKTVPVFASRQLTRQQDLRYVMMIYNGKVKDGKPQLRSQVIISGRQSPVSGT